MMLGCRSDEEEPEKENENEPLMRLEENQENLVS